MGGSGFGSKGVAVINNNNNDNGKKRKKLGLRAIILLSPFKDCFFTQIFPPAGVKELGVFPTSDAMRM